MVGDFALVVDGQMAALSAMDGETLKYYDQHAAEVAAKEWFGIKPKS